MIEVDLFKLSDEELKKNFIALYKECPSKVEDFVCKGQMILAFGLYDEEYRDKLKHLLDIIITDVIPDIPTR